MAVCMISVCFKRWTGELDNLVSFSHSYSHTQYPLILALPQSMGLEYSAGVGKQLSVVKVLAAFAHVAVTASLNTALV